jgi:hypothetical protein
MRFIYGNRDVAAATDKSINQAIYGCLVVGKRISYQA